MLHPDPSVRTETVVHDDGPDEIVAYPAAASSNPALIDGDGIEGEFRALVRTCTGQLRRRPTD
jgi:hypothetical protein